MQMSVLIILLCIGRSLSVEAVKESISISKENEKSKEGKNSEDPSIEQYDTEDTEYEDEDLSDDADIDMKKSLIKEGAEPEKFDIFHNKTNETLPSLSPLQKIIRLVRAVLPGGNSPKNEEVESDMEEDEDIEDTETNVSTEEQYEAELYDNVQPTVKHKLTAISDRSKRLTINAKKGTVSSSPDMIEIGEDESLNESDLEDYGDFLPTRKESMTVRTRQRKITSKVIARHEDSSVSTGYSKGRKVKDNIRAVTDTKVTKQLTKKVVHRKKGKGPKPKEKIRSALRNGVDGNFEELKKAYNSLVCSVENFMGLANKTVNRAEDNCMGSRNTSSTLQTTADWCMNSSTILECITTCDDPDFDAGEHIKKSEEDEDISSNMKKKYKGMKTDYHTADDPVEKSGVYVYNDYDSVDPNEYDMNVKSTLSPPSLISRPMQLSSPQTTETSKNEKSAKMVSSTVSGGVTTKEMSTILKNSNTTNDTTKEPKITWTTVRYETKIKLRPSRRQARRMSTDIQKILFRRKHHFNRHRERIGEDVSKEAITKFDVTNYPNLRNVPPNHEGDTEIIEVEYV